MSYLDDAMATVEDAQRKLSGVLRSAVHAEAFAEVGQIAALAEALKRGADLVRLADHANPLVASIDPGDEGEKRPGLPSSIRSAQPGRGDTYPRFERERDRLVKIGWSKRDRRTYEHRAPRASVAAVVTTLSAARKRGDAFTVEQIIPVTLKGGDEVPSYQVYMVVAMLRLVGAIEKRGKDGYVLPGGGISAEDFARIWDGLPEYR